LIEQSAEQNVSRGRMTSKSEPVIVAVDGPAGSGKSSICAKVCELVNWTYLNTGALYRGVGLIATRMNLDLSDDAALANMVEEIEHELRWNSDTKSLFYKDEDLSSKILSQEAGNAASKVAKLPLLRQRLLPVQRNLILSSPKGALVDGRDIGTVVFPRASLKIFLTASLDVRTRRRVNQLEKAGSETKDEATFARIKNEIASRDNQDEQRGQAPLRKADDAVVLDTSAMNINEVVDKIVSMLKEKGLV